MMEQLKKFIEFRNTLANQNPKALLDQLLASGKVTKEQVEDATKKAKQLMQLFK